MAVVSRLSSVGIGIKLENGTKDGKVKTVNLSLGSLSSDGYDDQKAMNIIDALEPCLAKNIYEIEKTEKSNLSSDE